MVTKTQRFTNSGTFTPSAKLLAAGGTVRVVAIGGGSSGATSFGGHGAVPVDMTVTISGAVAVTIGSGGAATGAGGNTTFGSLVTANGAPPSSMAAGYGAGSHPIVTNNIPGVGVTMEHLGPCGGGGSNLSVSSNPGADFGGGYSSVVAAANKGGGGARSGAAAQATGGSGCLVVVWDEPLA